jgi:hypothetical protein
LTIFEHTDPIRVEHFFLDEVNENRAKCAVLYHRDAFPVKDPHLTRFIVRTAQRTSEIAIKPFVDTAAVKHVSARESHRLVSRPIFYKTYGTVGCVTDAYIETIEGRETTATASAKG